MSVLPDENMTEKARFVSAEVEGGVEGDLEAIRVMNMQLESAIAALTNRQVTHGEHEYLLVDQLSALTGFDKTTLRFACILAHIRPDADGAYDIADLNRVLQRLLHEQDIQLVRTESGTVAA